MIHHGNVIKSYLDRSGMTTSELAEKLNVTRTTVYNLLDRGKIKKNTLEAICQVLPLNLEDFFTKNVQNVNNSTNLREGEQDYRAMYFEVLGMFQEMSMKFQDMSIKYNNLLERINKDKGYLGKLKGKTTRKVTDGGSGNGKQLSLFRLMSGGFVTARA